MSASLALGRSLAAAERGRVVQPCPAADVRVPVKAGSSSATVLGTLASPKRWDPRAYKEAGKRCCPCSPLLPAELALGVNKRWTIAGRNQVSAGRGPER